WAEKVEARGLRLVSDHPGRPERRTAITGEGFKAMLRAIDRARPWVKSSAAYRLGPAASDYARELVRVAGPERLVWASDCPFVGPEGEVAYQATIDWLGDAVPDAGARAKNFGATARALYLQGE